MRHRRGRRSFRRGRRRVMHHRGRRRGRRSFGKRRRGRGRRNSYSLATGRRHVIGTRWP